MDVCAYSFIFLRGLNYTDKPAYFSFFSKKKREEQYQSMEEQVNLDLSFFLEKLLQAFFQEVGKGIYIANRNIVLLFYMITHPLISLFWLEI